MKTYEEQAAKVAELQREAGWSEESIHLYAAEQKAICCDENGKLYSCVTLGAGLAQDNSRFGVVSNSLSTTNNQ